MSNINITTITFGTTIEPREIQCFRGAIVRSMGKDRDVLLHNHTDEGLRFSYPMVQYKVNRKKPQIVAIGSIGQEIKSFLDQNPLELTIGDHKQHFEVEEIQEKPYSPSFSEEPKLYSIRNYIALTSKNHTEYHSILALTDRIQFVEHVLVGNILSFLKGIGYHSDEKIYLAITSIDGTPIVRYKGIRFEAFDLHFVCNINLPDNIGLGKSSSVGFGKISKVNHIADSPWKDKNDSRK